ncbi:hypothetical protein MHU86_15882 [Fragilaria crotonensis]|nr:hypothetical protein MHU86_15882 [Fragilaria crotonensis]
MLSRASYPVLLGVMQIAAIWVPFQNVAHVFLLIPPIYDSGLPAQVFGQKHCKVLVLNHEHNYHYEVLESILALYPLPQLPSCNRSHIEFTIAISSGEGRDVWREQSASWDEYATQSMKRNDYTEIVGQSRVLEKVIRNSSRPTTRGYDYQIGASCYCQYESDVRWLLESETHFCVFHETCEIVVNSSRATWVNPTMPRSFFPAILPQFDHPLVVDNVTHNLCIVGEGRRREYQLVADYLSNHSHQTGIHFHHFGIGNISTCMKPFADEITLHHIPNFVDFQFALYATCDAILVLATRAGRPQYFEGPTKLSGSIVQAAVYKKPVLLHEDLAHVYRDHLIHVETYNDGFGSFSIGFERLLDILNTLKAGNAASS